MSGETNFEMTEPRMSASVIVAIWLRNLNFSRISWTLGEKPSRYASKSALSVCALARLVRSFRRNGSKRQVNQELTA